MGLSTRAPTGREKSGDLIQPPPLPLPADAPQNVAELSGPGLAASPGGDCEAPSRCFQIAATLEGVGEFEAEELVAHRPPS